MQICRSEAEVEFGRFGTPNSGVPPNLGLGVRFWGILDFLEFGGIPGFPGIQGFGGFWRGGRGVPSKTSKTYPPDLQNLGLGVGGVSKQ